MYAKSPQRPQVFVYPYQVQQRVSGSLIPKKQPDAPARLSDETISAAAKLVQKLIEPPHKEKGDRLESEPVG